MGFSFVATGMKAVVLLLLVALAAVHAQDTLRFEFDDFSVGACEHEVEFTIDRVITTSDAPFVRSSTFTQPGCDGLIGCSRDMQMSVFTGNVGRQFNSNIFPAAPEFEYIFEGEWAVSTPKGAATETILQYDGADETMDLNTNGLGSIDLTDGGLSLSFRFSIISDIETVYSIAIYSPNNGVCTADVLFPGIVGTDYDLEDTIVDLSFEDLDGNCDLESVGALELLISGEDAIDAILRTVEIVGLDDPVEPSPSPTRTPQPSASRPPSPTPTPSPTPSPAAGFTWYFDDDDNGRSPCGDEPDRRTYWVSDDNIIYYYFFGGNQRDVVVVDDSASSASALVAGLSFVVALLI